MSGTWTVAEILVSLPSLSFWRFPVAKWTELSSDSLCMRSSEVVLLKPWLKDVI
jgi:hypothetical protein